MTLTGNEMGPRTDFEIILASFMILMAYLANANIFGQMAALVQAINKRKNYFY